MRHLLSGLSLFTVLLAGACAPYVQLAGPRVGDPAFAENNVIMTGDRVPLPVRTWTPPGAPGAVIVALHGFNDYSKSFEEAGEYWASQGIATYAYDQRGFGRGDNRGLWHGGLTLARDAGNVVRLVKSRHPGTPVYIVGESMGGAVAMIAMAEADAPEVDGIVLSAPAVWGRATMNVFERTGLWFFSHVMPWFRVSGGGLGIKPSDNKEMLRALSKDPLVIKETRVDAVHGLVDLMDAAQLAAPRIKAPTLVLYGEKDEIVPPEPTYRMIAKLERLGDGQRVAIYPEGYHMLMRDLQAKVVLADIAAWIADPRGPLPSGADRHALKVLAEREIHPHTPIIDQGALPTIAGPAPQRH